MSFESSPEIHSLFDCGTTSGVASSSKLGEGGAAGAGAADHSFWRRRAISSSVSLGFDAFGGGFGGSSSSSDEASEEPSSEDDEDSAGFGERTVRTEGFGADSAVTSEPGADRRGRNEEGGDAPAPERRRTVAETSSTLNASAE